MLPNDTGMRRCLVAVEWAAVLKIYEEMDISILFCVSRWLNRRQSFGGITQVSKCSGAGNPEGLARTLAAAPADLQFASTSRRLTASARPYRPSGQRSGGLSKPVPVDGTRDDAWSQREIHKSAPAKPTPVKFAMMVCA
jgi:hypothetical protein